MGKEKCCVTWCLNRKGCADNWEVRSHVEKLMFHRFPKDKETRHKWECMIRKSLDNANFSATDNSVICSNHFKDGKPTLLSPFPSAFLTESDIKWKSSPVKRRKIVREVATPPADISTPTVLKKSPQCQDKVPMHFAQITRESDVRLFTGIRDTETFKFLFDQLSLDARQMTYWRGEKLTNKEAALAIDKGPSRKLSLEQQFLLSLMKLRLGLLTEDLAWRFNVSAGLTSQIFFTWVRLISIDLKFMIKWPSRAVVRKNLPEIFKKHFPKCVCIIDCTEVFIETPSSLNVQAAMWSEYKHHCTVKLLIGITPNGAISYLSESYGGRCSDRYIVQDSSFLDQLRPGDQLMADKGFNISDLLAYRQCSLSLPPFAKNGVQMSQQNVKKTSRVANARIYVENAIGRMKQFRILKMEIPVTFIPIVDDILACCCILTNLSEPLCV